MVPLPSGYSASPSAVRNQRGRLPPMPPLRLGELGVVQMLASVQQPSAAADDADSTLRNARVDANKPGGEDGQATLLLPAFRAAGVAVDPPDSAADRGSQPRPKTPDRPPEAGPLVQQIAVAALPLILAGAGDRSRPPAGTGGGQRALPAGALSITATEAAALGHVAASCLAEVLADPA